jgi:hypothetical protein
MWDEIALAGCSTIAIVMAWYVWIQCRTHHSSKQTKIYPTGVNVEHGIPFEEPLRLHAVVIVAEDD